VKCRAVGTVEQERKKDLRRFHGKRIRTATVLIISEDSNGTAPKHRITVDAMGGRCQSCIIDYRDAEGKTWCEAAKPMFLYESFDNKVWKMFFRTCTGPPILGSTLNPLTDNIVSFANWGEGDRANDVVELDNISDTVKILDVQRLCPREVDEGEESELHTAVYVKRKNDKEKKEASEQKKRASDSDGAVLARGTANLICIRSAGEMAMSMVKANKTSALGEEDSDDDDAMKILGEEEEEEEEDTTAMSFHRGSTSASSEIYTSADDEENIESLVAIDEESEEDEEEEEKEEEVDTEMEIDNTAQLKHFYEHYSDSNWTKSTQTLNNINQYKATQHGKDYLFTEQQLRDYAVYADSNNCRMFDRFHELNISSIHEYLESLATGGRPTRTQSKAKKEHDDNPVSASSAATEFPKLYYDPATEYSLDEKTYVFVCDGQFSYYGDTISSFNSGRGAVREEDDETLSALSKVYFQFYLNHNSAPEGYYLNMSMKISEKECEENNIAESATAADPVNVNNQIRSLFKSKNKRSSSDSMMWCWLTSTDINEKTKEAERREAKNIEKKEKAKVSKKRKREGENQGDTSTRDRGGRDNTKRALTEFCESASSNSSNVGPGWFKAYEKVHSELKAILRYFPGKSKEIPMIFILEDELKAVITYGVTSNVIDETSFDSSSITIDLLATIIKHQKGRPSPRRGVVFPVSQRESFENIIQYQNGTWFGALSKANEENVREALQSKKIVLDNIKPNLKLESLQCLRPGIMLNDEVMNYFFLMLNDREKLLLCNKASADRKVTHCFNTHFIGKLCGIDDIYSYEMVKKWNKNVPGKSIKSLGKLIVPVHVKPEHWTCMEVSMKEGTIHYHDSLGSKSDGTTGRKYTDAMVKYLNDEERKEGGEEGKWKVISNSKRIQPRGVDCGVFTCMRADYISLGKDFNYITLGHMKECRKRMIISILNDTILPHDEN
jgi:hypothetical protein